MPVNMHDYITFQQNVQFAVWTLTAALRCYEFTLKQTLNLVQAVEKELAVPVPRSSTSEGRQMCIDFYQFTHGTFSPVAQVWDCKPTRSEWLWQITDWKEAAVKWLPAQCVLWDVAFVKLPDFFVSTLNLTIREVFLFFSGENFAIRVCTFITSPPLGAAKWFLGASPPDCFIQTCFHSSNIWLLHEKITHRGFKCTAGNIWRLNKLQFYLNCQAAPLAPRGTLTAFF